jgi:hypothetical protein
MSATTGTPVHCEELPPTEPITFDEKTGLVRCVRRWRVLLTVEQAIMLRVQDYYHDGITLGPTEMSGDTIPASMSVTWYDEETPITLYPLAQRSVRWWGGSKNGQRQCELSLTYEGYVSTFCVSGTTATPFDGIMDYFWEPSSATELLMFSYDVDDDGNRLAIGATSEGVNVPVGSNVFCMIQNIVPSDEIGYGELLRSTIGRVNTSGWIPPRPNFATACVEGLWRYEQPTINVATDGTWIVKHRFHYDPARVHKHHWYFAQDQKTTIGGVQRTQKRTIGAEQISTIALTADFDDLFDPCYEGTTVAP